MEHTQTAPALATLTRLNVVPQSLVIENGIEYGVARNGDEQLVVLAPAEAAQLGAFQGETTARGEHTLLIGPRSAQNIGALQQQIAFLQPHTLGRATSAGMGDRLGLATPGHVRAVRAVGGTIAPIFTQQSIREMTRAGRSAQQVMDDAVWGVFSEGWREGFGADADHLKTPADIDTCAAVGYTFFTFDPGEYVDNEANTAAPALLRTKFDALPWADLQDSAPDTLKRYGDHTFTLEGHTIRFDEETTLRAAVKYGPAIAHVARMYQHLAQVMGDRPFEVEVSVDETDTPTTHAQHYYIAGELQRLGVQWVSLAPRYVGDFEKGVDYIGDLGVFEADFTVHAAIARNFGSYKLSLHSGSDKFSVYPITARVTNGYVHLKTAGTSYLEALRTIAAYDVPLFRDLYEFARARYDTDKASYHVSARVERAPRPEIVADADLPSLLEQFDAREILHVTFGSVLTTPTPDGGWLFYDRFMRVLRDQSEAYAANLERHFVRHLEPFVAYVNR